ncbi:MAG: hypothetical protein ACYCYN_03035 [Solirubrobacteraceae bacterium]
MACAATRARRSPNRRSNMPIHTPLDAETAAVITAIGGAGCNPRQALALLSGRPARTNARHGDRDVRALRALGIEPLKVAGRWVVPAGQIAAWARGELRPPRIDRRRREHRAARPAANAGAPAAAAAEVRYGL